MDYTDNPRYRTRTAEQMALSEERKVKRLRMAQQPKVNQPQLLNRPWISLQTSDSQLGHSAATTIKVMTWNVLAQTLVRRDLFPTSDCLKASQREPLLHEEILRIDADILCLQEVERPERLKSVIEPAGYSSRYVCGPKKQHGCLIAYKISKFSLQDEKIIFYDEEEVRTDLHGAANRGQSFQTRNVGFIVALQRNDDQTSGMIIATTHLFWHPKYTYERARQAGILIRGVVKFKSGNPAWQSWPCLLAGDFNFAPDDPVYSLLVGDPLLTEQEDRLSLSHVVHNSVDHSTIAPTPQVPDDFDEGGAATSADPDRVITNARPSQIVDGLLSFQELISFYALNPPLRSAYDIGLSQLQSIQGNKQPTWGSRAATLSGRCGFHEPEFTSYTHYWKSVLDYIFILDPDDGHLRISGLLSPLTANDLEPGLPQKNVCGSDHLPLAVELSLFK